MRILLFLFSIIITYGSSIGVAAEGKLTKIQNTELTRYYLAHIVANQPSVIGYERFAESVGLKSYISPGKELFRAAKKVKSWPQIKMLSANSIAIESQGKTHTFTIKDFMAQEYELDGKAFKIDVKKPLLPQVNKLISFNGGPNPLSFLIAEAWADDSRTNESSSPTVLSIITTSYGALSGAMTLAGGATVGAAGAAAVSTAALTYAGVCGLTARIEDYFAPAAGSKAPNYLDRFKDCATSPLRKVGILPKRLYISDIKCVRDEKGVVPDANSATVQLTPRYTDKIVVSVATADNSRREERTFYTNRVFVGNGHTSEKLESIKVNDLNSGYLADFSIKEGRRIGFASLYPHNTKDSEKPRKFVKYWENTGGKNKELNQMQEGLFRDYEYFRSVCDEPVEVRNNILREIRNGRRPYSNDSSDSVEEIYEDVNKGAQ